jgi:hypothetical protein
MMMFNLDANQVAVVGRYAATLGSGIVGTLVAVNVLSPHDAADINTNFDLIVHGGGEVIKGVAGLAAVIAPIYATWKGVHLASASAQVKSVVTAITAPPATQAANALAAPESRNELIDAVSKMPEVRAIIAAPPVAAATGPKVVATVADVAPLAPARAPT